MNRKIENKKIEKGRNRLRKAGFTLVESLVAIGILSLSIAGTFTAVQNGLRSSIMAKNQITAFYLTQEAMEFIKNIRDENALRTISGTNTNWLALLSAGAGDPCYFGKTCTIDSPLKVATACSGGFGTCPKINQNTATTSASFGLMGYTVGAGWTTTNFRREIQFQSVSADEVKVTISISWLAGVTTKSFQVTETLFNRQ